MNAPFPHSAGRRRFLKQGAGLTVGFSLACNPIAFAQQAAAPKPAPLPGSLQTNRMLSGWLRINADGSVTMMTGKIELGQGITTALCQIVSDELDIDYKRIKVISGDTALTPNEGVTSGSLSIQDSGTALRFASAEARDILMQAASAKLGVPADQLRVEDGTISGPAGRTTYWELTTVPADKREATAKAKPKAVAGHKLIGQSVQRRDIPPKVTGGVVYVQDIRLPGMLYGRVVRPPSPGAKLAAVDEGAVRRMPGVVAVVRDGNFLGVVVRRAGHQGARRARQERAVEGERDAAAVRCGAL